MSLCLFSGKNEGLNLWICFPLHDLVDLLIELAGEEAWTVLAFELDF